MKITERIFVNLRVRSHYSLGLGSARISTLIETARRLQLPALALTDDGVMYGALEFYHACLKSGIKPLLGLELRMALLLFGFFGS